MVHRQTIKHLLIALGVVTLTRSALGAAPQCSSLFETLLITDSALADTIDSLARLRIQLDEGTARGTFEYEFMHRKFSVEYAQKLAELQKLTAEKFSESHLRQKIRDRVFELQDQNKSAKEQDQKARLGPQWKEKALKLEAPIYSKPKSYTFDLSLDDYTSMAYVPKSKSLFYVGYENGGLSQANLLNLKTGKIENFFSDFSQHILNDDRSHAYLVRDQKVHRFDLKTLKSDELALGSFYRKDAYSEITDISPDGKYLCAKTQDTETNKVSLVVFEILTGREVITYDLNWPEAMKSEITIFRFSTPEQLIAFGKEENKDYQTSFHIMTMKLSMPVIHDVILTGTQELITSSDRSRVYAHNFDTKEITAYDSTSLKPLKKLSLPDFYIQNVTPIDSHPLHFGITGSHGLELTYFKIHEMDSKASTLDFSDQYTGHPRDKRTVHSIDSAPDGTLLVVSWDSFEAKKQKPRLDVYSEKSPKVDQK